MAGRGRHGGWRAERVAAAALCCGVVGAAQAAPACARWWGSSTGDERVVESHHRCSAPHCATRYRSIIVRRGAHVCHFDAHTGVLSLCEKSAVVSAQFPLKKRSQSQNIIMVHARHDARPPSDACCSHRPVCVSLKRQTTFHVSASTVAAPWSVERGPTSVLLASSEPSTDPVALFIYYGTVATLSELRVGTGGLSRLHVSHMRPTPRSKSNIALSLLTTS